MSRCVQDGAIALARDLVRYCQLDRLRTRAAISVLRIGVHLPVDICKDTRSIRVRDRRRIAVDNIGANEEDLDRRARKCPLYEIEREELAMRGVEENENVEVSANAHELNAIVNSMRHENLACEMANEKDAFWFSEV